MAEILQTTMHPIAAETNVTSWEESKMSSAPCSTAAISARYIVNWHQEGANHLQVAASGPITSAGWYTIICIHSHSQTHVPHHAIILSLMKETH